jgi:hypothetical protein
MNGPRKSHRRKGGIDFDKLARDRAALGLFEDGPKWTKAMDDPALSRKVLGLPPLRRKKKKTN